MVAPRRGHAMLIPTAPTEPRFLEEKKKAQAGEGDPIKHHGNLRPQKKGNLVPNNKAGYFLGG